MAYLFKKQFSISELANVGSVAKKILIAEPEEYLRQLYANHLSSNNFFVFQSMDAAALHSEILEYLPDLLIISTGFLIPHSNLVFGLQKIRHNFPALPVVAVSYNIDSGHLKELMETGIASHVERRFGRPFDIVTIAKTVLNY